MSTHGIRAYQQTRQLTATSRQNDARLLKQLCFNLTQALEQQDPFALNVAQGDLRLAWLTIAGALQDPEHPYPAPLKTSLLELSELILAELTLPQEQTDWQLVKQCSAQLAAGLSN